MRIFYLYLTGVLCLSFVSCSPRRSEIFEWRGPGRTGIYQETGLLKSWPEEGPGKRWVLDSLGNGYGSPVTDGQFLYLTGEIDSMAYLHCITTAGRLHWSVPLGKEWTESYPGSRSAPTLVNGLIYAGTGIGDLYCVDIKNGTIIWVKRFDEDFQGIPPRFGHSEAPVVDGDLVYWTPGGPEHNVVALNRFTGDVVWSNPGFGERSGYNQPGLIELPGRSLFVTFSAYHLLGLDAITGDLLWSHEQDNYPPEKRGPGYGDTHSNTVLYDDGYLYYVAGDGNGAVKLALKEDGSSIREVFRNPGFDSFMGGVVKIDRYLYGCGTARRDLRVLDGETGVITDSLRIGSGAVIAADHRLYYYSFNGELSLLSYEGGRLGKISSFRVAEGTKEHFAHPVIRDGILYQRHGQALVAYDIRED